MRVVGLTAWHVRVPLWKPIQHASHTRTDTDNLVVRCTLADGTVGYGEGVPREYVTGETIDSAIELVRGSDLPGQLRDCGTFMQAVRLAESIRLTTVTGDDRTCHGNSARCAVELALLDAYGQHFHEPLSTVTKLIAPSLYEPRSHVRYSGAITSAAGRKVRVTAWKFWFYGFRQVKVKVGIEGQNDIDRLSAIRSRMGRKVDLRIDANEAWTPETVAQRIAELTPFGISSVEQPVPHAKVRCLATVRKEVQVPIMLDESLCSMVDAERALEGQYCDLFNLRLSKCGGFIPALRLAQFGQEKGLGCQLGCQVGETAILSAAGRHFASSVRGLRYLEGSYDRHLVKEALGTKDLTFGWGGWAPALTGPGLGVQIDLAALERIRLRQEVLLG